MWNGYMINIWNKIWKSEEQGLEQPVNGKYRKPEMEQDMEQG